MHTNTYTHAHAYTYIHACLYTCIHTHIHTHTCNMYICTHTSTPGTTALQQIARRADADAGSSARLFHSTQSTIFSTFNARTSLYPHPETPIPLNPPPPLPNIPQNSSQTADAQFYCSTLINTTECMTLKKLPAQLHNGPLHSCRKIRGRAAVQQSLSRRARRNPSPRMIKVTVHEETEVNEKTTKPCNSPSRNHDSAAPRQHPLICTGAGPIHPVHGPPKLRAKSQCSKIGFTFSPFSRRLRENLVVLIANTSALVPDDRSQCPFCVFPIMWCAFGAHMDVGLTERPTPYRFIRTVHLCFL